MGLRFTSYTNATKALQNLYQYMLSHPGRFDLFITESFFTDPATCSVDLSAFKRGKFAASVQPMPKRYHLSTNYRISPVWIVPRIGYALTYHGDPGEVSTGVRLLLDLYVNKVTHYLCA